MGTEFQLRGDGRRSGDGSAQRWNVMNTAETLKNG